MKRISWAALVVALGVGLFASRAIAQQEPGLQTYDDIRARFEQQDRQIQQLQAQLLRLQQSTNVSLPAQASSSSAPASSGSAAAAPAATTEKEDAPQKTEETEQAGIDSKAQASFKDGLFLWLETPHKDFTMHLGAWMQWDNVWWSQSPALKAPPGARPGPAEGVASGVATGGIGELENGEYFRRIRPFAEGTFWGTGEYRLIAALENIQFNTTGLDEFWVGETGIPVVGTVRVGHVKTPMGLEGDMTASSRAMTFMERSSYSEAIELNQNFVTGVWMGDNYFDQRMTWAFAVFRPDQGSSSGAFFGDGQFGLQGRLTSLPLYEEEGRHLLHLGVSGGWRDGTANLADSPFRTIELRARPEMRDDVPAGTELIPNANSNRMIDTGVIAVNADYLMGLETLYIRGPLSFQAEYGFNWLDDAIGIAPTGLTFHPALTPPQDYLFHGGYVQLAYTLTGENRAYDKRLGTLAREYFGKRGPYANAWVVRDENGNLVPNWGAWEIAIRYSYVNLNDGSGLNRIQGGVMDGLSLALNWYLNNNLNVMLDWVYNNRYDVPAGTIPGHTSGIGTRVQFQF